MNPDEMLGADFQDALHYALQAAQPNTPNRNDDVFSDVIGDVPPGMQVRRDPNDPSRICVDIETARPSSLADTLRFAEAVFAERGESRVHMVDSAPPAQPLATGLPVNGPRPAPPTEQVRSYIAGLRERHEPGPQTIRGQRASVVMVDEHHNEVALPRDVSRAALFGLPYGRRPESAARALGIDCEAITSQTGPVSYPWAVGDHVYKLLLYDISAPSSLRVRRWEIRALNEGRMLLASLDTDDEPYWQPQEGFGYPTVGAAAAAVVKRQRRAVAAAAERLADTEQLLQQVEALIDDDAPADPYGPNQRRLTLRAATADEL